MTRDEAIALLTVADWEEILFLVKRERETTSSMSEWAKTTSLAEKVERILYPKYNPEDVL